MGFVGGKAVSAGPASIHTMRGSDPVLAAPGHMADAVAVDAMRDKAARQNLHDALGMSLRTTPAEGSVAFLNVFCGSQGPRQGKEVRQCVVTRDLLPKSLLWRVVRVRKPEGGHSVSFNSGQGRSAYVSRSSLTVHESFRKKRLSKALKCQVPPEVRAELEAEAKSWDLLSPEEKGLTYCEVYGEPGVASAVDEVQMERVHLGEDLQGDYLDP